MVGQDNYPYLVETHIEALKYMESYRNIGELDMGNETWLRPAKVLLLRNYIIDAKSNNRYIPPRNEKARGYLDYITTESNSVNLQWRRSHIPFSRVNDSNVNSMATKITELIGSRLNQHSTLILKYCINELLTNVTEHSRYRNSFIILQNYPQLSELEFAIMDDGISIPRNFEEHGIGFTTDSDSLDKALNGVSTKPEDEGRGHGLPSVFRVLTEGLKGEGIIISRDGIISWCFLPKNNNVSKTLYSYPKNLRDLSTLKGCFIAFSVRNDLSPNLYDYL